MTKPEQPSVPPVLAVRAVEGVVNALESLQSALLPPQVQMMNTLVGGVVGSQCIYVAAELGLADHLHKGPCSVEELADATDTHAPSLFRLLRALAGLGVFAECDDGRFRTNRLGDSLRTDAPGSMRAWARYGGVEWAWTLWGSFLGSIRNGKTVHENVFRCASSSGTRSTRTTSAYSTKR
jgi:hypothetical protein